MTFATHEMKYFCFFVFTEKSKFSFYFFSPGELTENKLHQINFFPSHFSLILIGSARLLGILLGVNTVCT